METKLSETWCVANVISSHRQPEKFQISIFLLMLLEIFCVVCRYSVTAREVTAYLQLLSHQPCHAVFQVWNVDKVQE